MKTTVSEIIERLTYLGFGVRESILSDVLEITQEPFSLGSTVEHLLGYYYIQDLSSCLAVSELDVIVLNMHGEAIGLGLTRYDSTSITTKGKVTVTNVADIGQYIRKERRFGTMF